MKVVHLSGRGPLLLVSAELFWLPFCPKKIHLQKNNCHWSLSRISQSEHSEPSSVSAQLLLSNTVVDLPSPRCVLAKPLLLASNLGPDAVLLFLLVNSDCFAVPCIHQACTYVCRQQARALGFTAAIIKFRN